MTENLTKEQGMSLMALDKETIALISKQAAEDAVSELRKDVLNDIKAEIENSFKQHFGDMSAFDHASQHSRIDKLLNSLDKISDNFWGQIVTGVIKWALAIFVVGYFMSGNGKIL
ncbi:hypothetical protein UFOVP26_106 [uncultured Caudovirales phage]|uniref:Uncharacterized protein n=1 Tax=uncultured Caudovirales phage TaxID=2100421 RepID=A0A6J7WUA5_9CAUD|nr:hypothetical protein UFOVP26_106 [uncultured Caudovirales phage]CAB4124020.1 hypothetical protein UFOVP44_129 [uncultured Caudovirales phage]CAB5219674.1 hypothetical protein UFOVP220_120 [uncultured Caudovirales phage]